MSTKPLFVIGWEVAGIRRAAKFFSALSEILPLPVNLCFEGSHLSPEALVLFALNAVTPDLEIPSGTIWPKPSMFHVRATEQFLRQLSALAKKHGGGEICHHFHAYNNGHGLVQWYDAFSGDPLLIAESIPETKVQSFCRKLGVKYVRRECGQR
jgi:hypothetical protein